MVTKIVSTQQELDSCIKDIRMACGQLERPHVITAKVFRKKRSISQNNVYWMWLSCIEEETGTDKNDLHIAFRQRFLGFVMVSVLGDNVMTPKSTTILTTGEFTNYLEKIRLLMLDYDITLPAPNDPGWDEMTVRYS